MWVDLKRGHLAQISIERYDLKLALMLGDSTNSSYIVIEIHYRDHNIAFIAIAIMIKHRLESDTWSDWSLYTTHNVVYYM